MNYLTKYFTPSLLALFQNDFIDIEQPAYIFVENSIFSDNKINYEGGVDLLLVQFMHIPPMFSSKKIRQ